LSDDKKVELWGTFLPLHAASTRPGRAVALLDVEHMLQCGTFRISAGRAGESAPSVPRSLSPAELTAIGAWHEAYVASQPADAAPLRDVEQSLAAQAETYRDENLAAHALTRQDIAGVQEVLAKEIGSLHDVKDLMLLLKGAAPKDLQIQARDPQSFEPLFDDNGAPILLSDPEEKALHTQRLKRLLDNCIGTWKQQAKKKKEEDAKTNQAKKQEMLQKELELIHEKEKACDVDTLGLEAAEEKLSDMRQANRILERYLVKRVATLKATEGAPAPKRQRGGKGASSSSGAAPGAAQGAAVPADAADDAADDTDNKTPDASTVASSASAAPSSASAAPAAAPAPAAAAPKGKARAKAKAAPMIVCQGKNRDDTPCKRKAPADIRFCCKHAPPPPPPLIEGQGFMCGYKGCRVLNSAKEHCVGCKALQAEDVVMGDQDGESASVPPTESFDPVAAKGKFEAHLAADGDVASATPGAPVESVPNAASAAAVCEHCSGNAAHDGTKYCKDCVAKLGKELGFDDEEEEEEADCAGGSAESSAAPGVPVEPTSAAGQQTAQSCLDCKEPTTTGLLCVACDKHRAEVNAEIEKRMAKENEATAGGAASCKNCIVNPSVGDSEYCVGCDEDLKNEAAADGAGGEPPSDAPAAAVEPARCKKCCAAPAVVYTPYCEGCAKLLAAEVEFARRKKEAAWQVEYEKEQAAKKRKFAAESAANQEYYPETKSCKECALAKKQKLVPYCDEHQGKIDRAIKVWLSKN
jgi:hypothetical protein